MGCLGDISKKDKKWRSFAFVLCKCKTLADDLVNDMYLAVMDYEKVNDWFVMVTIKNLYFDHCKSRSVTFSKGDLSYLKHIESSFEPNDFEKELLDKYEELTWVQQELIAESYYKSLRQIEKTFSLINYAFAHREIKKGREYVLGDKFETMYNNKRRKS